MKTTTRLFLSVLTFSIAIAVVDADTLIVEGHLEVQDGLTIGEGEDVAPPSVQADFKVESNGVIWAGTGAGGFDSVNQIPIGGGARLMWIPELSAFRVGTVSAELSNFLVFSQIGEHSMAWGLNSRSDGRASTAWGGSNLASGQFSTVWGGNNTANGPYSTAWGWYNTASGNYSTAWGWYNTTSGHFSTAWGRYNTASGYHSTAWGTYSTAESILSTVFGRYNIGGFTFSDDSDDTNDGNTQWFDVDPLFEIGLGDDNLARANALTLLKDGRIAFGEHTTLNGLQTQPETVQIEGVLKVGDYAADPGANASEGAIRFADDGSGSNDLLGYVDGTWKSLTQSGASGGTDQTLSVVDVQLTISGTGGNTVTLPSGNTGTITELVHPVTEETVLFVDTDGSVMLTAPGGDVSMGDFGGNL
jgi:hypothetical protein